METPQNLILRGLRPKNKHTRLGRKENGFSLIELIACLAIAAVLIGVGVPSYGSFISNSRIDNIETVMSSSFHRALAEAKKERKRVVVCARKSDEECGKDWGNGLLLYVDENDSGVRYKLDASEEVILIEPPVSGEDLNIRVTTRVSGSTSTALTAHMSIEPRTRSDSATIVICDKRGIDHARSFSLLTSGLTNVDLAKNSSGDFIDLWGDPIGCPS